MVTTFLLKTRIPFKPTGAKTQEREGQASGQADASYCIGGSKLIPDLSIEVIYTSGANKLARYRALGVPEVWLWEDGALTLHHLRDNGYEQINQSERPGLNQLDVNLLRRCILIAETDFGEAIQIFQSFI